MLQLEPLLATRVRGAFTLDLSSNYLLPETLPVIVSWLETHPLLRVELASNQLSLQDDLWPMLMDKEAAQ